MIHRVDGKPFLRSGGAGLAAAALVLAAVFAAPGASAGQPFGLDDVAAKAQALAAKPYEPPPKDGVPDWLRKITYDKWRDIRFRPDRALWNDTPLLFHIQFFHPGFYYDRAVKVNVVNAEGVHPVPFSPSDFDYGHNQFGSRVPQDLGFAGFRAHYPLNRRDYFDEVIVFLGASYFRALGKGNVYGLSARGLAVNTALATGEEFPWFREFWIARPSPGERALTIYALLDSPSVAGAYRFVVWPGDETRIDVEAQVYARKDIQKLGIAPLTSMFFFGENSRTRPEDYRPEVHDSDGLLMASATGEWIWRPLMNPESLEVNSFQFQSPKGFGLIQRDRDFDHYQDLEAHPEQRPSAWIEPQAGFEKGRVELVEIPTKTDINDNVVAYWVPDQPVSAGKSIHVAYRIYWYTDDPSRPPGGRAVATRVDRGTKQDAYRFVVDFTGPTLQGLPPDTVLQGVVSLHSVDGSKADLLEQRVEPNPQAGGYRLVFELRPAGAPVELRAFLQKGSSALTETWSYLLVP
jgi:glucans biosynthesis protein